jgi:hypothetical protein
MTKVSQGVVIAGTVLLLSSGAFAQAVVGPGNQTLTIGGGVQEFVFSATGVANTVNNFGFAIDYPADAPYVPVLKDDGTVDCSVETDLVTSAQKARVSVLASRNLFRIAFGDLDDPIVNFSRDGVIGRCKVMLKEGAAQGQVALTCSTTGLSASNKDGQPVTATCPNGTLLIQPAQEVTHTPTATATPPPSQNTATPTRTNTRAGTVPPTARPTSVGGGGGDDDGCQVVATSGSSTGWWLLAPAALLIWRRRKNS